MNPTPKPSWPPMPGARREPPAGAAPHAAAHAAAHTTSHAVPAAASGNAPDSASGSVSPAASRGTRAPAVRMRPVSPPHWGAVVTVSALALAGAGAMLGLVLAALAGSRAWRTLAGGIWGDAVGVITFPVGVLLAAVAAGALGAALMPCLSAHRLQFRVLLAPAACAVAPWLILAATPLARTLGIIPLIVATIWSLIWVILTPMIVRAEARAE